MSSSDQKQRTSPPVVRIKAAWVVADKYPAFDHKAIVYVLDVDGEEVRVGQWDGRFDGPVEVLAKHLRYLIEKYDLAAIGTTESQQRHALARVRAMLKRIRRRQRPLDADLEDRLNDGWQVRKRGEYLFMHDTLVFFEMPKVKPTIKALTAIAGYAGWRNLRTARFIVRHRQLRVPFGFWLFHGPSDIQDGPWFGGSPKQIAIAHRGFPRLARQMNRAQAKKPHLVAIAQGDTNASAREPRLHGWFEDTLDATSIWTGRMPAQGTHATSDRVIDNAFVRDVAGRKRRGDR